MCSQGNEYFPYILLLDHWPRILSPGFLLRHDDVLQNRTDHCGVLRGWPGPPRTGLNFRPKGHFPLIHDNMVQTTFLPECSLSFFFLYNCHEFRISFIIINNTNATLLSYLLSTLIFIMFSMLRSIWWGCKNRSLLAAGGVNISLPGQVWAEWEGGCRLDNDNVSCRCPAPARQYASRRLCWQSTKPNGLIKEFSKNLS